VCKQSETGLSTALNLCLFITSSPSPLPPFTESSSNPKALSSPDTCFFFPFFSITTVLESSHSNLLFDRTSTVRRAYPVPTSADHQLEGLYLNQTRQDGSSARREEEGQLDRLFSRARRGQARKSSAIILRHPFEHQPRLTYCCRRMTPRPLF
jgi:hypothetical protein